MAEARGDEIVTVFNVTASASQGEHRGEWAKLRRLVAQGRVKAVYVWALDRVSREGIAATLDALTPLFRSGCRVVSAQESWLEQDGPMRELLLSVFAWVAQMESQRRSERTKAGLERRKAQGYRLGRPKGSQDKKKRVSRNRGSARRDDLTLEGV